MATEENEAEIHKFWFDVIKENEGKKSKHDSLISDKLKFARMYNKLIHSGNFTERLMNLEISYWPAVEDLLKTRNTSLEDLQVRSSREIEDAVSKLGQTHTEASISSLSSRHCQDMERLLNNWNMSIEALKEAQREDFFDKLKAMDCELVKDEDINLKNISSSLNEPDVCMEESFTINLGSQLKTAHNLRILAVDSLSLCDIKRNGSLQVRAQTAMSLYSQNLTGLILLVDNNFKAYYGVQHEFLKLCNDLNEFHFNDFTRQIKHIQEEMMPKYAGRHNLETGDCYVTKHSNLANAHIIFHLVTDDSVKNGELNSRHTIMSSLRKILRVAHMYDVKTISIPLLLVDEMDEEILTVNWCLRRAELVLKCVKGFLIEMASLSTGVEQGTIQFLVPKGISEDLFCNLAALIPEVFRLANTVNLKSSSNSSSS